LGQPHLLRVDARQSQAERSNWERIERDEEYYTYTQPPPPQEDVASQLGVTQPQQPSQPSRPVSAEEYIASTEHLYESHAQSPVSEYSIIKTGAGNVYVYTASGWQKLEYKPDSNTYSLAPASPRDITAEVQRLGATGYKLDPALAEKLAEKEPHALMWGGVEEALRYARLREAFPELAKEKWITEADVQNVITQRLEAYGWKPDTVEKYEALRSLSQTVTQSPDVWGKVEAGLSKQLEEAQRVHEELQRFYEAKAIKQWDAERLEEARRQYEQFYRSASEATPAWAVPLQSFINNMMRFLSFGLINPPASGYEALLARYEQLASKAPAPGMMLPRQRIKEGLEAGVYTPLEQAEIKAIEKNLDPGKTLLYTAGYAAAFFAAGKVLGKVLEGLTGLGAVRGKALRLAERVGLAEREQLIPKEVESVVARAKEGRETLLMAKTKITEWGRAEELLGRKVPEGMRLRPGEVSLLSLEGGLKAPVVGEGEFAAVRFEGLRFTWEKGWEPARKGLLFARGTGEESFLAALLSSERPAGPRLDVVAVRARVNYAKILEQAMGGLPRAVLAEEGDILASVSRTPRIPVRELLTLRAPGITPIPLPVRGAAPPQVQVGAPRLPVAEDLRLSVSHAPLRPQPLAAPRFKPVALSAAKLSEAVDLKPLEFTYPRLPGLEPKVGSAAIPGMAPRLEPPRLQLSLPASPLPQPQRSLPRLPAPPPLGLGVRDIPAPRLPRLYGVREWSVRWFGPPEVVRPRRRGSRRRP
jgi:hypothetical protein